MSQLLKVVGKKQVYKLNSKINWELHQLVETNLKAALWHL